MLLLMLLLVATAGPAGAAPAPPPDGAASRAIASSQYCADPEERAFLTLVNNYRGANGRAPLFFSQLLGTTADHHSLDVATHNLDVPTHDPHKGSDGSTVAQRMTAHGYNYQGTNPWFIGENTTWGQSKASAQAAFDAWKASPIHNANMLKPEFKAIGIGRAFSPNFDDGWFWTTPFGTFIDTQARACGPPTTPVLTLSGAPNTPNQFVDNAAKRVFYRPATGQSGAFTVSAATSDAASGIKHVAFPALFAAAAATDAVAPYARTYAWSAGATASGAKTVTAVNGAGLSSSSAFTLVRDLALPNVAITAPAAGATIANGAVLKASANDVVGGVAGAGVQTVVFRRCAGTATTCTLANSVVVGAGTDVAPLDGVYQFTWSSQPADGSYKLIAVATDRVGNVGASAAVPVTVRNATAAARTSEPQTAADDPSAPAGNASAPTAPTAPAAEGPAKRRGKRDPGNESAEAGATANPTLRLGAAGGAAGSEVRVEGAGFAPGAEVILSWDGRRPVGAATAGADGRFAAAVTVPARARPGAHRVVATGPRGGQASAAFRVRRG